MLLSVLLSKVNANNIGELFMKITDDECSGCCRFSIQLYGLYIYIYCFCFVNSPLLLELPPCGQVQVAMDR